MSDSLWPHELCSPWNSPGQNTGVGSLSLLQGILPNSGIEPRSPTLQADSLTSEPPGKTKNTGVGSLCNLQRIFLSQESNWGLLNCRQILYYLTSLLAYLKKKEKRFNSPGTETYRVGSTTVQGSFPGCVWLMNVGYCCYNAGTPSHTNILYCTSTWPH